MNREFESRILNQEGKLKALQISEAFDRCLNEIIKLCPNGRELSLVKTKLEEAAFFAKKGMSFDPSNSIDTQ